MPPAAQRGPDAPRLELHQPFVHDLVGVFSAPVQAWSDTDGAITPRGAQGIYAGDTRIVSGLELTCEDAQLSSVGAQVHGARRIELVDVVSTLGAHVDPLTMLHREREADAHGITETLRVRGVDPRGLTLHMRIRLVPDASSMSEVKDPRLRAARQTERPAVRIKPAGGAEGAGGSEESAADDGEPQATWSFGQGTAHLAAGSPTGAPTTITTDAAGAVILTVDLSVPASENGTPVTAEASWRLSAEDPSLPFVGPDSRVADAAAERVEAARAATPPPALGALARRTRTAVASEAEPEGPQDPEMQRVSQVLARSLDDLDALRLSSRTDASETFFAAGAPWYFTLFGRDALMSASLALPLDRANAIGTLRTLAHRQGTRTDPDTAEQPGKILHEVRAVGMDMTDSHLPPVYFGTIDATALWIELLHETWRDGGAVGGVDATEGGDRADGAGGAGSDPLLRELLGSLRSAALWLLEHGDADGDGFLEYIDESGHGLANQGWEDSGDSMRRADGTLAEGTIALAEVQGYAYAAALHAAEMLEAVGAHGLSAAPGAVGGSGTAELALEGVAAEPGVSDPLQGADELPARLRSWAATLRERFRAQFWARDELGPYVVMALDGQKNQVDGVGSNMGHLLGTGLLDAREEALVVDRLMDPTMFSGYGIRTLSTTNSAYWPLRYHGGSVWTHDTGWILRAMLRAGFTDEARVLARGLLHAAQGFDDRLPELFGGQDAAEAWPPIPYPASCRPQAWAAASAVPIAQALGAL